jgi:hypothetical protein
MAATIELVPLSEHGEDVLDRFERATGAMPYSAAAAGARGYDLMAAAMPIGFESVLDSIDPSWTEHLDCSATEDDWQ